MDKVKKISRTQQERRDESRQRLLTAAADLIVREGFAAASLERIGEIAGYSRGLASKKFGSKDGLVKAVVAFVMERMDLVVAERLPDKKSPLDHILGYAEIILLEIGSDPLMRAYWVMMAAAIANRLPVQEIFLAAHQSVKKNLMDWIIEGQKIGNISGSLNPDAAAIAVGSIMLGISVELLLDPEMDMEQVRMAALESMARFLQPPGEIPATAAVPQRSRARPPQKLG